MKKIITKIFQGPPLDRKQISGSPPFFLAGKFWVILIEKHVDVIFTGKFTVFFSAPLLPSGKNCPTSFFASDPPNKC